MTKAAYYRRGPRGLAGSSLFLDTGQLFIPVNSFLVLEEEFVHKVSVIAMEGEERVPVTINSYTITPNVLGNNLTISINNNGTISAGIIVNVKKDTNFSDILSLSIELIVQGGIKLQLTLTRVSTTSSVYSFDTDACGILISCTKTGLPKKTQFNLTCKILKDAIALPESVSKEYIVTSNLTALELKQSMDEEKVEYYLYVPSAFPCPLSSVSSETEGYTINLPSGSNIPDIEQFPPLILCANYYKKNYNKNNKSTWLRFFHTIEWSVVKDGIEASSFMCVPDNFFFKVNEKGKLLPSQSVYGSVVGYKGETSVTQEITLNLSGAILPVWLEAIAGPGANGFTLRTKNDFFGIPTEGQGNMVFRHLGRTGTVVYNYSLVQNGRSPISIVCTPDELEFPMSQWGIPNTIGSQVLITAKRDESAVPFTIDSISIDRPDILEITSQASESFTIAVKSTFVGDSELFNNPGGQITVKLKITEDNTIVECRLPWKFYYIPQSMPVFELGTDGYLRATYTQLPDGKRIELTPEGTLVLRG